MWERAHSAVLGYNSVIVGNHVEMVQILQNGGLMAEGFRLVRVLALEDLHCHKRAMPACFVDLHDTPALL